jgi:hypothetical protein
LFVENIGERLYRLMNVPICTDRHYTRTPISKDVQNKIELALGCYLCEIADAYHVVHHIQPDGEAVETNLVLLCLTCHEWVHYLLYKHKGYKKMFKPRG